MQIVAIAGHPRRELERADEDEELADEPAQPRQPAGGEAEEAQGDGPDRQAAGDAAHLRDRPVVGPLVDHADEQEQRTRDQPMVDHLEDRPVHALLVEDEDPERHEAHVRDGAVRDELLQVRLDERDDRAVDDRDQAQDDDRRRERVGGRREERHREPDHPVRAELQDDRGEDHRAGGRRLDVGVRQPRVERPHRDLDRERQEEGEEREDLEGRVEAEGPELLEVERAGPDAGMGRLEANAVVRIATSIRSDPTSVYRTNLIVA